MRIRTPSSARPRRSRPPRSSCPTPSGGGSGSGAPRPGRRRGTPSSAAASSTYRRRSRRRLLLELDLGDRSLPPPSRCRSPPRRAGRGDQLREHPGERVDLVAAELGARRGARAVLGQDALEPEHEAVAHLPARDGWRGPSRSRRARRRARRGAVSGASATSGPRRAAGRARRTTPRRVRAAAVSFSGVRRPRRGDRHVVHSGRTYRRAAPSEELTLA